ncbi:MAG TPA: hypothetical protein D7I05_03695, partial [Candidatus Poseidoniales archaeon]
MNDGVKGEAAPPRRMDLRLAVLSRGPRLYSTRRLVEEAQDRGLDMAIIDPLTCSLFVDQGRVEVLVDG